MMIIIDLFRGRGEAHALDHVCLRWVLIKICISTHRMIKKNDESKNMLWMPFKKKKIEAFLTSFDEIFVDLVFNASPSTSLLMSWFVSCGCLRVWIHRLQALVFYLLFGNLSYVIKKNLYGLYQFHLMYLFMGLLHNKQETCEVFVNNLFLCPFIWCICEVFE
jgi:hypothetical protein